MTSQHRPDCRFGRWQDVLADVTADALICDPPYSARTHAATTDRNDGTDPSGLTPTYAAFTPDDVHELVSSWHTRCRGWIVCLTDHVLIPAYERAYEAVGRYAFAPVPCVTIAGSVRMQGDGPSSWTVYAMMSRPRTPDFVGGWTSPGWFHGGPEHHGRTGGSSRGGGRGKPHWLTCALVRHYSRAGDRVVDPFMGWGTTLAACAELGRIGIGAECDAEAYAEACRRLAAPQQIGMAL